MAVIVGIQCDAPECSAVEEYANPADVSAQTTPEGWLVLLLPETPYDKQPSDRRKVFCSEDCVALFVKQRIDGRG